MIEKSIKQGMMILGMILTADGKYIPCRKRKQFVGRYK